MMIYKQQKKNGGSKGGGGGGGRLLISITVLGSAGPIRFVVNEGQLVGAVIETTLKSYAREGRLPVLGSDLDDFVLYCPIAGNEALSPLEAIGSFGVRNFMLCKKAPMVKTAVGDEKQTMPRKGNCNWKAWFNKSLSLKISSH
ncbi:uncharacterized protein At4g22758-like [Rhododendron vialii]|uniref:DUF7054 domain-containing protein n=1 Tax=Rhododendron simsii TaxID=118357 RepID=A0A834GGM0_RHOSS|nr:uncharacterized protein At4g22758-like [Rhododendron vialii]KAF7133222.1 hypothetical protein RHSIM_Rhsim09G0095000 [Rhododendron simsii]